VSCEKNPARAAKAAGQSGVSQANSKSGFLTGDTAQVSFFAEVEREQQTARRRRKRSRPAGRQAQVSFFKPRPASDGVEKSTGSVSKPAPARKGPAPASDGSEKPAEPATRSLPTSRQIKLAGTFTPAELDKLAVQLRLGAAATNRQVRTLNSDRSRGIGHSDPRPLDWARSDQKQYRFLTDQLRQARRGGGAIDTAGLKKKDVAALWQFARFEADRAHRNIDHLTAGLSHLKGPTAAYLTAGHKLEARFYTFLADQLESLAPEAVRAEEPG